MVVEALAARPRMAVMVVRRAAVVLKKLVLLVRGAEVAAVEVTPRVLDLVVAGV